MNEMNIREVMINSEPVELYKILKFEGMVPSGGVAKLAIDSGDVVVNGEIETRKRKKMLAGDVIEFNGECVRLVLDTSISQINYPAGVSCDYVK